MKSYVLDSLVKYHCFNCNSEFILSEYREKQAKKVNCPYCQNEDVEAYVYARDEELLNGLGCLAIAHHEDPGEEKYVYEMTWGRIEREREKYENRRDFKA